MIYSRDTPFWSGSFEMPFQLRQNKQLCCPFMVTVSHIFTTAVTGLLCSHLTDIIQHHNSCGYWHHSDLNEGQGQSTLYNTVVPNSTHRHVKLNRNWFVNMKAQDISGWYVCFPCLFLFFFGRGGWGGGGGDSSSN